MMLPRNQETRGFGVTIPETEPRGSLADPQLGIEMRQLRFHGPRASLT